EARSSAVCFLCCPEVLLAFAHISGAILPARPTSARQRDAAPHLRTSAVSQSAYAEHPPPRRHHAGSFRDGERARVAGQQIFEPSRNVPLLLRAVVAAGPSAFIPRCAAIEPASRPRPTHPRDPGRPPNRGDSSDSRPHANVVRASP